jgi:hypothetical protein
MIKFIVLGLTASLMCAACASSTDTGTEEESVEDESSALMTRGYCKAVGGLTTGQCQCGIIPSCQYVQNNSQCPTGRTMLRPGTSSCGTYDYLRPCFC